MIDSLKKNTRVTEENALSDETKQEIKDTNSPNFLKQSYFDKDSPNTSLKKESSLKMITK